MTTFTHHSVSLQGSFVSTIIHGAATSAAGVGAGLAQIPGSDAPVLMGIQSTMILAIAHAHGVSITQSAAAKLILPFSASVAGRGLSQFLVGWIPGFGNAINAGTAFAITQAVGWAADAHFRNAVATRTLH